MAIALGVSLQELPLEPLGQGPSPAAALPGPRTAKGGQIKEPKKTRDVQPKWPRNALLAGLHGAVVLECTIDPEGRVIDTKTLRGYRSLAEAATEAVRKWTYTPTLLDGVAVPVIMTVTVHFRLRGRPSLKDALKSMADPDPEIRWAAVQWLGAYQPAKDKQRKAVEAAVQDESPLVRGAAETTLKKLAEGPR